MDVYVFGGAPAAGPADDGDRFVLETPGGTADDVLYTPTAVDAGTLVIDEDRSGAYEAAGGDTIIQLITTSLAAPRASRSGPPRSTRR